MNNNVTPRMIFTDILMKNKPDALAWVRGNKDNPQLSGLVKFYNTPYDGILVEGEIFGLPNVSMPYSTDFYGFHIHENGDCTKPFDKTGEHYAKENQMHPDHLGDMPPIMGNQGYAWFSFYNRRVKIPEIMGRSVVIHDMPDDFTSQPSGNAGEKIGCGIIREK